MLLMATVLDSANGEFIKSDKESNNPSKLIDKETWNNSSQTGSTSNWWARIRRQ